MSKVTALDMGGTRLLLDAWQVKTAFKWRRSRRSRRNTFLTWRSGKISYVSSIRAFSSHHVTRGGGCPGKISKVQWKCLSFAVFCVVCKKIICKLTRYYYLYFSKSIALKSYIKLEYWHNLIYIFLVNTSNSYNNV